MSGNKLIKSGKNHNHLSSDPLPYKLVSREVKPNGTVLNIQDIQIGGPEVVVMAGPCAVESREQLLAIAK
ncbi:unnamed protein product, partial [marine sediment metagenome]